MRPDFAHLVYSGRMEALLQRQKAGSGLKRWIYDGFGRLTPPKRVSRICGPSSPYGRAAGLVISISLSPDQAARFPLDTIAKRVLKAGKMAARAGARIVGIGALGEIGGNAGVALARTLKIAVTTGKSFVTASALDAACQALGIMGIALDNADVLLLGAAGASGSALARLLAGEGINYLTLVAADSYRLEALSRQIFYEYGVSCKVTTQVKKAAGRADLIIAAGKNEYLLDLNDIKPGAVFYDLAGAAPDMGSPLNRRDILLIEESVIRVPGGESFQVDRGFPPQCVPASMVEPMVLALEGRCENYSLGRELRISKINEIRNLAIKHGFSIAGYLSRGRFLSAKDVAQIQTRSLEPGTLSGGALRPAGPR